MNIRFSAILFNFISPLEHASQCVVSEPAASVLTGNILETQILKPSVSFPSRSTDSAQCVLTSHLRDSDACYLSEILALEH